MKVQTQKKMDISQESRLVRVCVDQSANTFYVLGLDSEGETILRRTFRLESFRNWMARPDLPRLTVAMKACGRADWLKDFCKLLGHTPMMISPGEIKCNASASKNNYSEAESIKKASFHPKKKAVSLRTSNALDLTMLIAVRHVMLEERTALTSRIRAFLLERGLALPVGASHFNKSLSAILDDRSNNLTQISRTLIRTLQSEIEHLSEVIKGIEVMMDTAGQSVEAIVPPRRRNSAVKTMGDDFRGEVLNGLGKVCAGGDMTAFLGLIHGLSGLVSNPADLKV